MNSFTSDTRVFLMMYIFFPIKYVQYIFPLLFNNRQMSLQWLEWTGLVQLSRTDSEKQRQVVNQNNEAWATQSLKNINQEYCEQMSITYCICVFKWIATLTTWVVIMSKSLTAEE